MENKKFACELEPGKKLEFEFRNLAEQASGNILVRYGENVILSTCVIGGEREGVDFFPLTVEYEEKYYAGGKIKGSRYMKREGKSSDEAICNSRLVDRAVRPLFPEGFLREIQLVNMVLSWDGINDPDVLALNGASMCLLYSNIPWQGPVAAVRVGRVDGKFIINPNYEEKGKSDVDITFAAIIKDNELLVNMIEAGFSEVNEDVVVDALSFAENYLLKIIEFQKDVAKEMGVEKIIFSALAPEPEFEKEMRDFLSDKLEAAIYQKDKIKMKGGLEELNKEFLNFVSEKNADLERIRIAKDFLEKETARIVHENIIKHDKRPDGRKLDEVRELNCEAGILPRTHGSGLFSRGQTRTLSILTLGAPGDQQLLEGMEISGKKRFMHHYNFPSYSTGEIKPSRGPGRREIGHGMLAEKALLPLMPNAEEFPYTIRVVSEVLSSNGSSSMASTTSSSLALMDGGVPIKRAATGISIGLVKDRTNGEYKLLTDIQGPEDHYGDMDFKVAGTREGITAMQMDVKIEGINKEMMKEALEKAKKARFQLLDSIEKVLPKPRESLSPLAPRILTISIDPEKIREVIGPGGKVINEIVAATGATIDIEQTGLVFITAEKAEAAQKALEWVKNIVREAKVGEVFEGTVVRIMNFGAFVEILPGQDGMVHISKLGKDRVDRVEDVVKIGDKVVVKVIEVDELGRINLSLLEKK